jgi:hypothetical protein
VKRSGADMVILALLLAFTLASGGCGASGGDGQAALAEGARYRVSYQLACLETIDYMQANQLFNFLLGYRPGDVIDPRMQAAIASAVPAGSLSLLVRSGNLLEAKYALEPQPLKRQERGGYLDCSFDPGKLPDILGIPYVTVEGELSVGKTGLRQGDGASLDAARREACLQATSFWPAEDPQVQALAREIAGGTDGAGGKVEALHSWVRANISYRGAVGTRYGTMQVLSQGYGRCWDASDVFVSLCRACGLPARQISGWLAGPQGSGHIWSQVWLEGEGWVDVDTTSDRIGAGEEYVPFRCTEDGEMPVLYVSMPEVDRL